MSASPLLTINAAADQLQRDRRTIAAHLRDIPPDDKDAQGRSRWRLATIVRALNDERPQGDSAAADAVEQASRRLADGLKLLEAVEDIEQRRKIAANDVGRLVGALDKAMESAAADRKPHDRRLLGIVRDKIIGDAIGVLMRACRWELQEDRP